jgi:thiamine kinase-like enzyme
LKSIRAHPEQDSTFYRYWKREYEIYQFGLLDTLHGSNLIAPVCYQADEFPGEGVWLWLEDVSDNLPRPWSLERFSAAAQHLGQFNGRFLAEGLPSALSQLRFDWLRKEAESVAVYVDDLDHKADHPFTARLLSDERCQKMRQLWTERERFFTALDHLPQTVSHGDCYSRNLFDQDGKTILIDWQMAGIYAVGTDLSQIISGTVAFDDLSVNQARALDPMAFDTYLQGLFDAGWFGDPWSVRLGYTAYASIHNLFRMLRVQSALKSETGQTILQSKGGHSLERHIDQWIEMFEFFDELADEARSLISELER